MATRIIIPEPCSADWNQMTPSEKGRHCALCAKTVVDFTSWSLNDIASYLRKHSSNHVCGRFNNSQLNVEIPYSKEEWVAQVAGSGYSLLQKMALIFLVAFGFLTSGCESTTEGEPRIQDTVVQSAVPPEMLGAIELKDPLSVDSPNQCVQVVDTTEPMIMGEIAPPPPDTSKTLKGRVSTQPARNSHPERLMGKPATVTHQPRVTAGAPMMVEEPRSQMQGDVRIVEDPPAEHIVPGTR